ncbi:hypothetical protein EDD31_0693 [Bogoriella caseilytica]|uniref:Uncharacterized protein n=1 Tax=Bogoriella caseilytica TaxID=56055 RepID=A0A3N2BAZ5_9MICO|nr:hypothetical protein EDD31_0693 [Bogoriella caseilytica]
MRAWQPHGIRHHRRGPVLSPRSGVNGDQPERVTRVHLPRHGDVTPPHSSSAVRAAQEAATPP